MSRRRFLKYAGASAVVGGSAIGLDYVLSQPPSPVNQSTAIQSQQTLTSGQITTSAGAPAPPVITNLQWTPTRVVNDKVHDGTISFEADGVSSPVVGAELEFEPVYPSEIPKAATPQEDGSSYSLTANSTTATFSQLSVSDAESKMARLRSIAPEMNFASQEATGCQK